MNQDTTDIISDVLGAEVLGGRDVRDANGASNAQGTLNAMLAIPSSIVLPPSSFSPPPSSLLPIPAAPIDVRPGTRADIPFIDTLQKRYSKALGFFPRAQLEGYLDNGWVLVATDRASGEAVGYVAARDRYLKRDELGVVYQLCVSPTVQRGLIGATLLKALFERSAYGCRLYCCWCAQDLEANRFWEAMGFTAIAFRGGSAKRGKHGSARTHIFWQKRIRSGDCGDVSQGGTPWWFPAKTEGGALRADRLVLPIPPGLHWSDAMPVLKGTEAEVTAGEAGGRESADAVSSPRRSRKKPVEDKRVPMKKRAMQFGPPGVSAIEVEPATEVAPATALTTSERPKREASTLAPTKCDPQLIAAARELRDRYLEQVNAEPSPASGGKYAVTRTFEERRASRVVVTQIDAQQRLLPAA